MKRLLIALSFFGLVLLPATASAQFTGPFDEVCEDAGTQGSQSVVCQNKDNTENPLVGKDSIFMRAVNIIAWIIGVASIIIIIIAGLKYVTSSGDPKGIESAKNTLIYAVIGLVIFLLAQGILLFVADRLQG